MIIDRPEVLRGHVEKNKPRPSHKDAELLFSKCKPGLDRYAAEFKDIIDEEWNAGRWMNFFPSPERPQIIGLDQETKRPLRESRDTVPAAGPSDQQN